MGRFATGPAVDDLEGDPAMQVRVVGQNRYESAVRAEFTDASGNLLFALDGTTVGRRINVTKLP